MVRATTPFSTTNPAACSALHAPLLEAGGLVRRYGQTYALRGVDLTVGSGERVALLGPNGAGKTTLIRVLATALRPAAGTLLVGGLDAARDAARARRLIGLVGHQTYLYADMTVRENLRFYGQLYSVQPLESRIDAVLDAVHLEGRADDLVRTLSRGLQQRASLARAILHRPSLLLLDEPETGLDDAAQRDLGHLLTAWARDGGAVVVATHRLEWAQPLADRAVVLEAGRVVDAFPMPSGDQTALATAYRAAVGQGPERQSVHEMAIGLVSHGEDAHADSGAQGRAPGAPSASSLDSSRSLADPLSQALETNHAAVDGVGGHAWAFARQSLAVLAKDLRIEWRTKDALTTMLVFAFLVLVTFNFALDLRPEVMAAVGPGVLWIAVVFASTLGLGRTFAVERDQGTLDGLLVAPLDRSALFLAKLLSNLAFMLALEAVTLPAFIALFNLAVAPVPVFLTLTLGAVGLAAVGTLFSAMAAHTRAREVMLPVLLFPVIVPILIGVVQATGLVIGSAGARDMPWLSLLAAFAVMYVAAGAVVFEYVLEE
jgi:heme ABC exporter ATP-binding subunit CcmA/heme exporter protein CcmB